MPFIAFDLLFNNRIPVNVSVYAHNGILSYELPASSYLHKQLSSEDRRLYSLYIGSVLNLFWQVNLQDATEAFINLQVYPILR